MFGGGGCGGVGTRPTGMLWEGEIRIRLIRVRIWELPLGLPGIATVEGFRIRGLHPLRTTSYTVMKCFRALCGVDRVSLRGVQGSSVWVLRF